MFYMVKSLLFKYRVSSVLVLLFKSGLTLSGSILELVPVVYYMMAQRNLAQGINLQFTVHEANVLALSYHSNIMTLENYLFKWSLCIEYSSRMVLKSLTILLLTTGMDSLKEWRSRTRGKPKRRTILAKL